MSGRAAATSLGLRAEPEVRAQLARLGVADEHADERFARIAWSRLVEPGDGTAGALCAALGTQRALALIIERERPARISARVAETGIDLSARAIEAGLGRWLPRLDRGATRGDIERAVAGGMTLAAPGDAAWPDAAFAGLGEHAPTLLWLRGDPRLLTAPALAVVGARAATGYGTQITADIVDGVTRAGVAVVSGAAYGIDAVAHRTALAAQAPTVAVLAGGADRHYPSGHEALIERIAREGLVCAEMLPGSAPTKWRFRQRNRIIAALAPGTLVTEAGMRSGTLNTAGHAAALGRALGAVPGPVTSAASSGCHLLIREYNASLITNAREACELIGVDDRLDLSLSDAGSHGRAAGTGTRLPSEHERVLDALPLRGARTADDVARRAGLSLAETRGALAELELLGVVQARETPEDGEPKWRMVRTQ